MTAGVPPSSVLIPFRLNANHSPGCVEPNVSNVIAVVCLALGVREVSPLLVVTYRKGLAVTLSHLAETETNQIISTRPEVAAPGIVDPSRCVRAVHKCSQHPT